ncbi:hypothetical protein BGZ57DRAFT_1000812 [Hyaloscypha finlandica]|nr:hypothetical protein BGZ57DRAFT_1000812 [Hyaloscypha finlandica]
MVEGPSCCDVAQLATCSNQNLSDSPLPFLSQHDFEYFSSLYDASTPDLLNYHYKPRSEHGHDDDNDFVPVDFGALFNSPSFNDSSPPRDTSMPPDDTNDDESQSPEPTDEMDHTPTRIDSQGSVSNRLRCPQCPNRNSFIRKGEFNISDLCNAESVPATSGLLRKETWIAITSPSIISPGLISLCTSTTAQLPLALGASDERTDVSSDEIMQRDMSINNTLERMPLQYEEEYNRTDEGFGRGW